MMGREQRGRRAGRCRRGWTGGVGGVGPLVASVSLCAGDRQESPRGTLHVAIDKDSLGKFLSLVLRHSSVIQPCQVGHETKKGGK